MSKRLRIVPLFLLALALSLHAAALAAQSIPGLAAPVPGSEAEVHQLYAQLLPQIDAIQALDNHSHPGFADDPDVDAQAAPPGMTEALRVREQNPEHIAAARALFGYPFDDLSQQHLAWLTARKADYRKRYAGTEYFDRILDKVNIGICLANRVAMPAYLDPKRFKWVFFVDSFLFPFPYTSFYKEYPDDRTYLPLQDAKLHREMREIGMKEIPPTLDGYIAMMAKLVALHQQQGGIAMKFEAAYFRPLTFTDPSREEAYAIYGRFHDGVTPTYSDYLILQDYIFRQLLVLAQKDHLPVHFHTAVGIGDYFSLNRDNVMNLEPVLRDPRYNDVTFVLLHGGYPLDEEAIWLTMRKNVYFDTSLMDMVMYPEEFKNHLKTWLTVAPEKVIFGTDAFPYDPAIGAEEAYWIATNTTREALAEALAELISEGVFTQERAMQIAHAYLHDTAAKLYGY
jgi:hypothetical protein